MCSRLQDVGFLLLFRYPLISVCNKHFLSMAMESRRGISPHRSLLSKKKNWVCSRKYDIVYYARVVLIFRSLPSAEKVICRCCMLRARDWAGYWFLLCAFGTGWVSSISPFSMAFCTCYGCTVSFGNTIQCGWYMMVAVYSSASFKGIEIRIKGIWGFLYLKVCCQELWFYSMYGLLLIFRSMVPWIYV
jgi:hypothetical protein